MYITGAYMGYMLLAGLMSLVGMYVSGRLKNKFAKYSQQANSAGLNGKEIAQTMLHNYNIQDVVVVQSQGLMSDHYNPLKKTIALSPEVYHGRSIAAAAVAAHECGHAVQHAVSYPMLRFRSGIVPFVKVASVAQQYLLLAALGGFGAGISGSSTILLITIAAFGITTLFALLTLPVEFDASKRALQWLNKSNIVAGSEYDGAKDALQWAAMTYVAAALSSLVMLLFLLSRLTGSRE